jgi:hypothetical protein
MAQNVEGKKLIKVRKKQGPWVKCPLLESFQGLPPL